MQGMQRMVGTERFNVAMQSGGRDSVEGDWAFISTHERFEDGFFDVASGFFLPNLIQEHAPSADCRQRIDHIFSGVLRRCSTDRFKHGNPFRIDVASGRDSHTALDHRRHF